MSWNIFFALVLSPTYVFADFRKQKVGKEARTDLIKKYNKRYLQESILLAIGLGLIGHWNVYLDDDYHFVYGLAAGLLIWLLPLSRCNEIFYAFINDALDKVAHKEAHSKLLFHERIRLAMNSYIELVVNFGIIYFLLPFQWFNAQFPSIADALYFSGVTITTLGYGDYSPSHILTQGLVVYEVFCGFILLIVSFTIYAGRGLITENGKAL